jgi:hypothetical protein
VEAQDHAQNLSMTRAGAEMIVEYTAPSFVISTAQQTFAILHNLDVHERQDTNVFGCRAGINLVVSMSVYSALLHASSGSARTMAGSAISADHARQGRRR